MLHRRLGDHSREAAALDATGEACQRAHRFAEAIGFHRVAAATFRELDDRWQLALSLEHLATALAASDGEHGEEPSSHAEVTTSRAEAADMLRRFTDPLARRIHARLTS